MSIFEDALKAMDEERQKWHSTASAPWQAFHTDAQATISFPSFWKAQEHIKLAVLQAGVDVILAPALAIAATHAGTEGAQQKAWVLDQVVRALLSDKYDAFVAKARNGVDGPETFDWDVGTAP